jgi:arsenite-transporting ATPase
MAARTILYTGKGGVGKTSVAAATARRCAASGLRTLVISTDPAHSLGDVLEAEVGSRPAEVAERLSAQQVESERELERNWTNVRRWLSGALVEHGVERIAAEELTVPPGADELFSLLEVHRHAESGEWDVIVVDCAPTGETLRLLSFPDAARWWLDKIFGRENQLLAAARPFALSMLDISLPSDQVFKEVRRLIENLVAMDKMLRDTDAVSLRLVMTPDRIVVSEAMRTFTYLNLYGYLTDAVVVNRVFPDEVDTYFHAWRDVQREQLEEVESGFAPVPVLRAPYFEREVAGPEMLDRLAGALFESADPAAILHRSVSQAIEVNGRSASLRVELPFARKGEISVKKIGLELVVSVEGRRRTIALPSSLAAFKPAGAAFEDGSLLVRFEA